jgi:hypothetical protein
MVRMANERAVQKEYQVKRSREQHPLQQFSTHPKNVPMGFAFWANDAEQGAWAAIPRWKWGASSFGSIC